MSDDIEEIDWHDEVGFVEDMIGAVRAASGAKGYTIIVTHRDGSITRGSKGIQSGGDFQMLGAVAYEMVKIVNRIDRWRS
jgi:hypothetical protein